MSCRLYRRVSASHDYLWYVGAYSPDGGYGTSYWVIGSGSGPVAGEAPEPGIGLPQVPVNSLKKYFLMNGHLAMNDGPDLSTA
jgi:hypothetical protein